MSHRDQRIATRHGEIAITETASEGPPVLLIHGNSNCRSIFRHQLNSDLGRRYRMIAMDLPGHGESDDASDPKATYNQVAYAEAAAAVLAACQAEEAVVMGWSLGGHIGIEMTYLCRAMKALTFSGTPPASGLQVTQAFTPLPHMSFTSKEVFSDEDARTYALHTCGVDLPIEPDILAAVKRTDGRARALMFQAWLDGDPGNPQAERVAEWEKPIAVIQGSDEEFFDNAYLKGLTWANLWEGKIHEIEGGGHAPFWAKPEAYNALFGRFLDEVA
ncbi:MAG: alpha/beta hydrolase [Pseudomonadota bacterium]